MSPRQSPSTKDDAGQSIRREEALHRSLRECTTRRLTHFNPCNARHVPTLTSRVQWNNGTTPSETVINRDVDCDMVEAHADDRDATLSPVSSEIDELDPSDDDQPQPSRGSTTPHHACALRNTTPTSNDARSSRSCSDSSDTEKRQPNFPGNRDIIDGRFSSASPSPPTHHSAELETPSPVSDVGNGWPLSKTITPSTLGLQLHATDKPLLREERLARVGSWRVESPHQNSYGNYGEPYRRYGIPGRHDTPQHLHPYHSPSLSASSAPPSPPPVLPPIHHLNATLPVNTGSTPGVMHWRFREPAGTGTLNAVRHSHDGIVDDYDDCRSSTGSPQSLPPLLPHIKMMTHSYPPPRPLPAMMPISVAPPMAPLAIPARNKNAWKDYAQLISKPNEQTEFRCVWPEATGHCGYTAKRHLVKRHIETRHLQFKDHICPYCGKAFPQRVSLMIHVNRHTGAKPHPCRYVDCDKTFSDPARRHKHMVEAHGYNPQGPRKRYRTVDSYHTNKSFETLAPWTAKGERPEGAVANP